MWLLVRLAANAAGQPILVPSTARNPHPGHDPTTPTDAPGSCIMLVTVFLMLV